MTFMVYQYAPRNGSSQVKEYLTPRPLPLKCEYAASMRLSALRRYPAPSPLSHNGLSWCHGYLSVAPKVVKTLVKENLSFS